MKRNNIYLFCLKVGYKEISNGITYKQIKKLVTDKFKIEFSYDFEFHFRVWFFNNFYEPNAQYQLNREINGHVDQITRKDQSSLPFEQQINTTVYIKGDSIQQYIDYVDLSDARKSSRSAYKFAMISIVIALFAILIPWLYPTDIKQPIDVNVINDTVYIYKKTK